MKRRPPKHRLRSTKTREEPLHEPIVTKAHGVTKTDTGLFATRQQQVAVGIDPSLTGFGLAAVDVDDHRRFTTWRFATTSALPKKHNGTDVIRLLDIEQFVTTRLENCRRVSSKGPVHVAIEGYSFGSQFNRERSAELGWAVRRSIATVFGSRSPLGYPTIATPGQVKKYATGAGKGVDKNQVLKEVYKRWGADFSSDDEADAYVLALMAAALESRPQGLLGFQTDVLDNLNPHTDRPSFLVDLA